MRAILAALLLCLFAVNSQAYARQHKHHRPFHGARSMAGHIGHDHSHASFASSIETIATDAGMIRVASRMAEKFKGLIHDFVSAGYHPRHIGCFARGGHVRHSRHYLGEACDFDQTGWGKTQHFMYSHEAAAIIRKWGLTNGCSFRDCGHVGTDGQRRYARAE